MYAVKVSILSRGEFDPLWLIIALENNTMRPSDPAEAELWRLFYADPRDAVLSAILEAASSTRKKTPHQTTLTFVVTSEKLRAVGTSDAERVLELAVQYAGHKAVARVRPLRRGKDKRYIA